MGENDDRLRDESVNGKTVAEIASERASSRRWWLWTSSWKEKEALTP